MSFKDYIMESTKYMYDDTYIKESKVSVDGKKYNSKKSAEEDLKKKGLKGKQVADKMKHSHEIVGYAFWGDGHPTAKAHKAHFKAGADKHHLTLTHLKSNDNIGDKPFKLTGTKENLKAFRNEHKLNKDDHVITKIDSDDPDE